MEVGTAATARLRALIALLSREPSFSGSTLSHFALVCAQKIVALVEAIGDLTPSLRFIALDQRSGGTIDFPLPHPDWVPLALIALRASHEYPRKLLYLNVNGAAERLWRVRDSEAILQSGGRHGPEALMVRRVERPSKRELDVRDAELRRTALKFQEVVREYSAGLADASPTAMDRCDSEADTSESQEVMTKTLG